MAGWVATPAEPASQPAVETVSSVSRPGESACGPRGRRKDAPLGRRGTVGRRAAVAAAAAGGKDERETKGTVGSPRGPEGSEATAKQGGGKRWERQGETWCAACDSARNERIGQQYIAKAAPQRLHCTQEYTHVQSDPEVTVTLSCRRSFRYCICHRDDWKSRAPINGMTTNVLRLRNSRVR